MTVFNSVNAADVAAVVLAIVAVMVVVVNIVVEVIKKLWGSSCPATALAFVISLLVSVVGLLVYCSYTATPLLWYYVVGAVLLAFFVSYAAMFGFDKLKQALSEMSAGKNNDGYAGKHEADK